ncbi:BatD family protein [Alteromonas sp. D210916BOD_24]|uniref:BatD family protein n=1 Tax=Alteromonas sp. D210916BOD_24 TaxID=3157618 RepID=UPI00399CA654
MKLASISTILIVYIFTLFGTVAQADINSVEATIDRNPVMLDEAIRLTITADGSAERDAFDSSPLLKDFVVGRTSVSSQTSIVNFDTKRTTVWTTTLFPRKEGNFTIPALTIEGKRTQPIQVKVIPVQEQTSVARDYFVTTDIDLKEAYLNQQLLYTVKLYLSSNIERGSLQAPEMQNAEITQLGDDKQYTDIVNGKRYQIIERQFAVVPQASGEFTLRGPIFSGEVMAPNTNQRFGFFNRTQQVNRVGPDITVTIKPIPQGIGYPWLPSEMVRVDEEWPQGDNFIAGEPVTRIITLTALGVVEEQLPEIPEFYPPNFKLYPDQSNTTTVEKDQHLISQRQTSLAIIPTEAGSFVLPEITIPWFNTLTEKTEYATIPARSITVLPPNNQQGQGSGSQAIPSGETNTTMKSEPQLAPISPTSSDKKDENLPVVGASKALVTGSLIATGVLTCLWIITAIAWWTTRRKLKHVLASQGMAYSSHHRQASTPSHTSEQDAFKHLLKAAKSHDVKAVEVAFNQWIATCEKAGSPYGKQNNGSLRVAMKSHIDTLQSLRFSPAAQQGKATSAQINEAINALIKAAKEKRQVQLTSNKHDPNTLSNLYPA